MKTSTFIIIFALVIAAAIGVALTDSAVPDLAAGAIIFLLTASIVALNFATDILLALIDPRVRRGMMG